MELPYSRRSFIVGVLTCGSVTASATYLLSDPGPDITLRIGSGSDPSGGRELLIRQWNAMHREAKAEIIEFGTSTTDQRERLRDAARTHAVDIVNLDVIDVPAFAQDGLIEELDLSTPYLSKRSRPAAGTAGSTRCRSTPTSACSTAARPPARSGPGRSRCCWTSSATRHQAAS